MALPSWHIPPRWRSITTAAFLTSGLLAALIALSFLRSPHYRGASTDFWLTRGAIVILGRGKSQAGTAANPPDQRGWHIEPAWTFVPNQTSEQPPSALGWILTNTIASDGTGWAGLNLLPPIAATTALSSGALLLTRRHPAGTCPSCGYDLAGLAPAAPCPECGSRHPTARHTSTAACTHDNANV